MKTKFEPMLSPISDEKSPNKAASKTLFAFTNFVAARIIDRITAHTSRQSSWATEASVNSQNDNQWWWTFVDNIRYSQTGDGDIQCQVGVVAFDLCY